VKLCHSFGVQTHLIPDFYNYASLSGLLLVSISGVTSWQLMVNGQSYFVIRK